MLPTPHRLLAYFGVCNHAPATNAHVLTCGRLRLRCNASYTAICSKLTGIHCLLLPPVIAQAHLSHRHFVHVKYHFHWYSLDYNPTMDNYFGENLDRPHFLPMFEQHHFLSASLGMQDVIFPPIHTLRVPPLLTKYFQEQRIQCLGDLSLLILILSSTYHAFTLWQAFCSTT